MTNYFFKKDSTKKEKTVFYTSILIPALLLPLITAMIFELAPRPPAGIVETYFFIGPIYLLISILYNLALNLDKRTNKIVTTTIFLILTTAVFIFTLFIAYVMGHVSF